MTRLAPAATETRSLLKKESRQGAAEEHRLTNSPYAVNRYILKLFCCLTDYEKKWLEVNMDESV